MSLGQAVRNAVGIRPGEASRVGWLVAHSLFVGLFSAFFLTSANALFLARFEISFLPVAYIATALVGYVALMLFSRLLKAVPLPRALVVNLAFLLVVAATLWLAALASDSRWVAFLMFVWVGPAFSLLALGYWALAGRLFDLRQGKRLFALVGAGEEVVDRRRPLLGAGARACARRPGPPAADRPRRARGVPRRRRGDLRPLRGRARRARRGAGRLGRREARRAPWTSCGRATSCCWRRSSSS